MINAILCIASFAMFFTALFLDFIDRKNGSFMRRCLYFVCLLINVSFMMRVAERPVGGLLIWWVAGSAIILVSKILQYKDKTRWLDDKVRDVAKSLTHRGKERTAHR